MSYRTLIIAGVLLVLAGLCARMLLGARQEVALAQAAAARGERDRQVRHLRRAMAHYLPGNPWVAEAHQRLLALARQAQARGDKDRARAYWGELRGAVLRLRGVTRPYAGTLAEANTNIAALSGAGYAHGVGSAGRTRLLARLASPPEPHPVWTLVALLGFLVWVGGAALLLLRGLRPDASIVWRRLWPLAAAVAGGFMLFCAGLSLA